MVPLVYWVEFAINCAVSDGANAVAWPVKQNLSEVCDTVIQVRTGKGQNVTGLPAEVGASSLNEALYFNIIENCADAVVVADRDQTVTYVNKSAESMFGYASEDLIGNAFDILIPAPVRTRHHALAETFRQSGEASRYMQNRDVTIYALRADGSEFPVNVSILKIGSGAEMSLVAIVRDITEQKQFEQELEKIASTDPLTGILNRRTFLPRAEAEYARAQRYGRPMTFAMIDIDRFKRINDKYGHSVGDQALCHVVNVISDGLRLTDVLCRWGGEEFALILTETDEKSALITMQRLRRSVQDKPLLRAEKPDEPIPMTVSIGFGSVAAGDGALDTLINRVDQALYTAKRTGRNKVCAIDDISSSAIDAA